MTLEQFIAEIENSFRNYAETGDIDRISIKGWVIDCLREFGKNICELRETIVEVDNSSADLPDNFKSLKLALKLNAEGYRITPPQEVTPYIYKRRIENEAYFDEISQTYVTSCDSKVITEAILIDNKHAEVFYQPEWLSVVKGMKKDYFDVDCLNIHPAVRYAYPNQINITKRTLNANFRKGIIYIQYFAMPSDENGEIEIPEITTGDIKKYIENYVKLKIGEDLILNNKNPVAIAQLMGMWKQDERLLRNAAKSEANWHGLPKGWAENLRKSRNIEMSKYNLPRL